MSVALFMTALDNLVGGVALPSIRLDLGGSIEMLEWTVNAYTLTFAVLLVTGAALGDRFGRKRMFVIGLRIFTGASALAALAPTIESLIAARALQGLGAAIVLPLTLTLLSEAVPGEKRGMALGIWAGVSGLGVALGPFVGGAVVEGIAWQWIFWLNVPIGIVLLPLALRRLEESRGPAGRLDLPGVALASAGLFAIVWALVRGNGQGWGSAEIVGSLAVGGCCSLPSSCGSSAPRRRCSRCGSSARAPSPSRTSPRSSCSSGCSGRSSFSRSSSRPCRATARSAPGSGSCRGRLRRCSSPPSQARSRTGSARG